MSHRIENLQLSEIIPVYAQSIYGEGWKGEEGMYAQTVAHAGAVKAKGERGFGLTRILPGSHSLCTRSAEY